MQTAEVNIIDVLLGSLQRPSPSGTAVAGAEKDLRFDALLSGLLGREQRASIESSALGIPIGRQPQFLAGLFQSVEGEGGESQSATVFERAQAENASTSELPEAAEREYDNLIQSVGEEGKPGGLPFSAEAGATMKGFQLLPNAARLASKMTAIADGRFPVSPIEGSLIVTGAAQHGSDIELTLVSADRPDRTFLLRLPSKVFDDGVLNHTSEKEAAGAAGRLNAANSRVQLVDPNSNPKLNVSLLQDVQLKEIRIISAEPSGTQPSSAKAEHTAADAKQLILELAGTHRGEPVTIRQAVDGQDIKLKNIESTRVSTDWQRTTAGRVSVVGTGQMSAETGGESADFRQFKGSQSKPMVWSRPIELGLDSGLMNQSLTEQIDDLVGNNLAADHARETGASRQVDPVMPRLVLPREAGMVLKPNGPGVMLVIEPEHLGPARLHLVMRGGALSARVTVDSALAQNVIESSLDHLHQQLERAGIKVDHIDVNVAGGESQAHEFADQSESDVRRRITRLSDDELEALEASSSQAVPSQPIPNRIGPGGVNVLA